MTRSWRITWLVTALLFAQLMLATHGVAHASGQAVGETTEICAECLALAGIQSAAPASHLLPDMRVDVAVAIDDAVPPAPTIARLLAFYGRAPPPLQS